MRKYRKGCRFIGDVRQISRKMTSQDRAGIWCQALSLERQTRQKGFQNGVLGKTGIEVLRTLLFKFMNLETGACFPSVKKIMGAMAWKCSRNTAFVALRKLVKAGIIVRIARCKWAVRADGVRTVVQQSNAYQFFLPKKDAHLIPLPARSSTTGERVKNLVARWAQGAAIPLDKSRYRSSTGPEGTSLDLFERSSAQPHEGLFVGKAELA